MTLTYADLEILAKPFQPREHEFLRGLAYIREEAVTTRIEQVDPAWELAYNETIIRDNKVTVYVTLTIKGVSRAGAGQGMVNYKKDSERTPDDEINEAEKSAITDALKRSARLFGVGRYLLSLDKSVRDENTLRKWLLANYAQTDNAPQQQPSPPQPSPAKRPTHNPFDDAQQPTSDGNTVCTKAEVKESKTGKPYIVLSTEKGTEKSNVTIWTRQLLKDAGWVTDDDLGSVGDVMEFDTPEMYVTLAPQKGNSKYYDLVAVADKPAPPEQQSLIDDGQHDATTRGSW